ncbi:beta strand repeat-containing protein, partial [Zymomonas mobilis]
HNSSVTNDPVTYSFTLSEPVSDFTADDVVVSGGTKGNLVQDSTNPLIYHMTVTPLANQNGTITATIAAGAIHDMAGNASTTEVTASNIFDTAAPTVTVTSNSDAVTANGPVTYTFTASEPLEIFTADKIKVSGGTKGELVQDSTNPLVYTMVVTPDASSEGNLTVSIPAGAVQDVAGNPTAAASGDTVAYDTIIPAIVITSDSDGSVASGAVNYTFTASEALNNFTDDDVTVTGGTKGNLVQDSSDPLIYHMTVTPDSDTQGSMTVTVPAGKVADTGGNTTAVDSSDSVSYNTLPPTANITSDHVGVTATGDIIYTASFNWFVSDFTVKNLEVTNGTIRSITEVSNGIFGLAGNSYQIVVTPESDNAGTTTLSISPGITGLLGTLSGSVDFDTRQLSLQDYTDTGLSSSDHISQDNTYTLSLDNAAKGSTPTYQLSTDNGVTWTNTTAAQNAVPDGHYLYRSVTEGIDGTLISNNSIAITVDTTKPDLISVNPTNGQTVSGVGEAGATINILSNDKATVLGTTTADSSNHWSISGLNIANNTPIKVTATDVAGNVSSAVTTRVDATPPAVTVNASNGDTLSGTSEAGSVIKVDVNGDGTPDYTQTVGVDGQWLIRPDTALANGTAISVTSTDPVGNVSSAVSTTVDNVIPTVTLATTDNQTLTGTVNNSTVTSVTVTDQAGNIIGTADVTNGNYSLTLPSILPEGTSLTATATDAATNVGMSSPLNIVYDRDQDTSLSEHEASISRIDTDTLPTSAVSTTQDNDFTTRDTDLVVAGGSLLASGDILQISTDGSTWTDITSTIGTKGNWAWKDPATHNSSFTYYIRTVDSSGNVLYTATKDVTIDITAPITPKLTVVDGGLNVLNTEAGTVYAIIDDTNRDGVYEQGVDTVISTSDGTSGSVFFGKMYSLGVVQYDTAGNYSRLSSTLAYEIPPDTALNTAFQATVAPPQEARDTAGMSVGFDSSGNLTVLQRSSMITQTTATSYALTDVQQLPYFVRYQGQSSSDRSTINATTQVDYNRDGYSDVVASDYINANTLGIAVWTGSLSGYSLTRVGDSTNSVGGVMAYDKEGDGYVDFVLGNWGAADGSSNGVFVKNTQGVLSEDGNDGLAGLTNLQLEREVSGVDLKGDGNIDIAAHTISNSLSTNQYALALIQNNGGTLSLGQNIDNVFDTRGTALGTSGQAALPTMWNAQSMVWADFANNGQMDLYLSQGNNTPTGSTYDDSRVYMNNNGVLNATPTIIADDNIYGGAATAVDWNHDGKMDVIEIRTTVNTDVQNIPITLLTNNGLDANGNLNPFTATNMTTVAKANITGIAAVDVNWDGAVDLLYSTTSGSDTQADGTGTPIQANVYSIENTNTVDDGTSLHLKILDQNGINSYFGNTVQLFDSTGHLVSTQIINPQEGVWDNDSTAIVNFYNLDPTQHYSVALVRATDGQSNDIGGQSSYSGTGVASALDTIENIEQSWNNLTPGAANHGYVLEGDTTTTHTIGGTFTGTGYNDTFFAGPGNNTYIGGGGWGNDSSGDYAWMSAGGNNIVDYSSETAGITANMGNAVGIGDVSVNKSDGSNDTLKGIQGIIGTQYDDTFNNDGKGDYFVGGGGDDTYNLSKGGHDTLMYKLLSDSDNTGGNGSDTVNDFHLGNITTDANADVINIKDLLADYQGTANVYYDVTDNKYVLDKASSGLDQFVNVSVNNGNTTVSVDRDGTNGSHEMTSLVTLNNTQTDLATLIGNHQLIIA